MARVQGSPMYHRKALVLTVATAEGALAAGPAGKGPGILSRAPRLNSRVAREGLAP